MSSRVGLSSYRDVARDGERIGKRKDSPYKTNCHEQEKGVGPLYRATTDRRLDDPEQAGIHPTFSPTPPSAPHRRSLPLRFDTVLKVVLPPSSFHHCQPPTFPPRKILFLLPKGLPWYSANEDNRANTSYALHYRVCLSQCWMEPERLYKFLTRIMRWSVKAGEAITGIEIIAAAHDCEMKILHYKLYFEK